MFGGAFDFLLAAPYEERVVARWDSDDGESFVSTCRVCDGLQPLETAVLHPAYNDGKMMIVEAYPSVEQAEAGHAKWVALVKTNELPDPIADCCNAKIASLGAALAGDGEEAAEEAGLLYRRQKPPKLAPEPCGHRAARVARGH